LVIGYVCRREYKKNKKIDGETKGHKFGWVRVKVWVNIISGAVIMANGKESPLTTQWLYFNGGTTGEDGCCVKRRRCFVENK